MKYGNVCVSTIVACLVVVFPSVLRSQVEPPTQQTIRGMKVSVVRLYRVKEYKLPFGGDPSATWPKALGEQPTFTAEEGQEIAVVCLSLTKSPESKVEGVSFGDFWLYDVEENKFRSLFANMYIGSFPQPTSTVEVPFAVPKGSQLKTFQVEGVSFDLEEPKTEKPKQ